MMKVMQKMISFLLENANPSIIYRVKKEILHEISREEEDRLQELILSEKIIRSIIACQKENGWLGNGYHGSNKNAGRYENQETGVKYLAEKGVRKETDVLKRAMLAFKELPFTDPCYRNAGEPGDEFKYAANGSNLFRCACIARAGFEDFIDIAPQIQLSLDSFRRVLEVDSILDVSRPLGKSGVRVFHEYEKWPCRYHLDILAHTAAWRTEDASRMLADSVEKLMRRDRPELVGLTASTWAGHVLATTGGFPSQGLTFVYETDGVQQYHMEYLIWLARCGVIRYSQKLQEIVESIQGAVNADGVCEISVDAMFRNWGPYGGLQLETDWKSARRRNCDITFRALQLIYYTETEETGR